MRLEILQENDIRLKVVLNKVMFTFKQFAIKQQRTAMKVGTDGVLLGSWVQPPSPCKNVLDIGTGTGLLALMLAQRFRLPIDAVEIDIDAALEATENVRNSPFLDYITVVNSDIRFFETTKKYDLIVCNPPFFVDSMQCPNVKRSQARHSDNLTFEVLLSVVERLLTTNGFFSVIYPINESNLFMEIARNKSLYCVRELIVYPTPRHLPKRRLMTFSFQKLPCISESLVIEQTRHCYTDEYKLLTKDFYLNF